MFRLSLRDAYVVPRTELSFPAHRVKMYENATRATVDAVMADLEDACPPEFKGDKSRSTLVDALNSVDFGHKVVCVRPNGIQTDYFSGDVEAVVLGAPDRFHGIVLPKSERAEDIADLCHLLDTLEKKGGWRGRLQIEALVETPLGLINAFEIATSSDRMAGLIFGVADFGAALGVREVFEEQNRNFLYAKQAIVVAAKAAGLHAIDSVYGRLVRKDSLPEEARAIENALRQKNAEAARMGMDGSMIIHPAQAEVVNACFTPTKEQAERAKQAVELYCDMGGGSVFNPLTGEFEDEATIKIKLADLAKAVQAALVGEDCVSILTKRLANLSASSLGSGGVR